MPERTIILFDGMCNLCNGTVNFLIDRDPEGIFVFGALQSQDAQTLLQERGLSEALSIPEMDDPESILVLPPPAAGKKPLLRESEAALYVAGRMGYPWKLLRFFLIVPRPVRDGVYRWVARNRYRWFGRRDTCRIPTPDLRRRFLDGERKILPD